MFYYFFFFQAEDGIRDIGVTGVQTCALPIFDVILRRRNWANASFCCGAGSIHRREAVMEAALRQWSDQVAAAAGRNEQAARRLTGEAAIMDSIGDMMRWQSALEEEFQP